MLGDAFDARDAVRELGFRLMEELDTGFVGRAERRRLDDGVLLVDRPYRHGGWFVGAVPLRAQEATARTGERVAVVDGSPITGGTSTGATGGRRRSGRRSSPGSTARPLASHTSSCAPTSHGRDDLVLAACRAAVEAGSELLVADRGIGLLLAFGFGDDGRRLVARFDEVRPPE